MGGKCWETAANAQRKKDDGLCCVCGSTNAGTKRNIPVDHIIPRRLMERWGFEVHNAANLASLCIVCHAKKTAVEWKLFEGDTMGFVVGLAQMSYPKDRVLAAFVLAEFSTSMVERVYGGIA